MPHDRIDQELVLFREGSLTFLERRFLGASELTIREVIDSINRSAFLGTNLQLTLTVATNTEYSSKPKCVRAPVALGACSSWFDVQRSGQTADQGESPLPSRNDARK